ncbi:MAG: FtsL-like putative cell division protein, partial [Bacteroidota bacterium]
MKKPSHTTADQAQGSSWNLWSLLDPERWAKPVLVQKHGWFVGYLSVLMLVYIAYIHQCERRVRQISKIEKHNQELRSQYLFLKTELVRLGQLEKVVQRATAMGFKEMRVPPLAIGHA